MVALPFLSFLRRPYWKSKILGPGIQPKYTPTHAQINLDHTNAVSDIRLNKKQTPSQKLHEITNSLHVLLWKYFCCLFFPFNISRKSNCTHKKHHFWATEASSRQERKTKEGVKKITQLQKIIELIKITVENNSKIYTHSHTCVRIHIARPTFVQQVLKITGQQKRCELWKKKNTGSWKTYIYTCTST